MARRLDPNVYRLWVKEDGGLAGARFDAAIDAGNHTRMTINLGNPALSGDDADTTANELRTHLVVTGTAATGKGMFSFGDLLGSGMASDEGTRFIDDAVKAIEKVKADVSAGCATFLWPRSRIAG